MPHVFHHPCVRDMAWALSSPPLMQPVATKCSWFGARWYRQLFEDSVGWLHQLDEQPQELLDVIADEKDKRLGKYFETLWDYYFQCSSRFTVLRRNLQVHHRQRTLGELDFIVHDEVLQKNIHIEMAIKFYLGVGDTASMANWHGPGKQDRLDIKMKNLIDKQSVFSRHTVVVQQLLEEDIQIDQCAVIMKGRLFYPHRRGEPYIAPESSDPSHLKSYWYRYSDYSFCEHCRYMPLVRSGWMASQAFEAGKSMRQKQQLDECLSTGKLRLPLLLVRFNEEQESERIFLVPDDWPNDIHKMSGAL